MREAAFRAMSRSAIFWFTTVAAIWITACVPAQSRQTIVLKPGQDVQAIVANSPKGTRFHFEPGLYRQQTIRPRDR